MEVNEISQDPEMDTGKIKSIGFLILALLVIAISLYFIIGYLTTKDYVKLCNENPTLRYETKCSDQSDCLQKCIVKQKSITTQAKALT